VAGAAGDHSWHGSVPSPTLSFERLTSESLAGGLVWLRYVCSRSAARPESMRRRSNLVER